jgi:hypothetical protein
MDDMASDVLNSRFPYLDSLHHFPSCAFYILHDLTRAKRSKHPFSMNLTSHISHPQRTCPGDNVLQVLKSSLNPDQTLTPRCLKDPILVSIDVGLAQIGQLDTIGIACLDSRLLTPSRMEDSITTRLLLLRRRSLPLNQRTRQYLFNIPEHSPPKATRDVLPTIFSQVDQERGGPRNIFLVGHNIKCDIRYLEDNLDFSILSMPSIVTVIDTQQLARRVFKFWHKYISLKLALSALGITARQLHNSGNDAVYTLKVLLLMFCSYQEDVIDQSKLCARRSRRERDGLAELLWRECIDLLRLTARCCPRKISLGDLRRARWPPRPPRVDKPDLFEIDASSDGEIEDSMIAWIMMEMVD